MRSSWGYRWKASAPSLQGEDERPLAGGDQYQLVLRSTGRLQILPADGGNLVVEVLGFRVLRALLDHLVLEQSLEHSVLGLLVGVISLGPLCATTFLSNSCCGAVSLGPVAFLGAAFLRADVIAGLAFLGAAFLRATAFFGAAFLRARALLSGPSPVSPSSLLRSCSQP